ncbi:MAG: SDR family NAD(P)-dependent oxidoreductase [Clostridia bacterium]|nr:SDR family NAD(P)-dependent oxidoreductase [Clostridia bacterium]
MPQGQETWQGRRVLVTGAGGFVGSHLAEELVRRGASVTAFVHYNSRSDPGLFADLDADIRSAIEVVAGDVRDEEAVLGAARGQDVVFHLAAVVSVPYSFLHPDEVLETNVRGTLNVLRAARHWGTPRVVHTSSSEVYGSARRVPIGEDHPLQAQSPYAASKIAADKLAESYWLTYGLPVVTVRPFNTYGPRQSARAVIPAIIVQALHRPEIRLGNLEPVRDFCYVVDTVDGFLRAAAAPAAVGGVFNLGTGRGIRIGDLAALIRELVGRDVPIAVEERRVRPPTAEVTRQCADSRAAAAVLGWQPQTDLETGLRRTIDWIRRHPDRYRPDAYEV